MYRNEKITLKENPSAKAIIKKAFPDYRKHTVYLSTGDGVELSSGYWDGGSKTSYYRLFLPSGIVEPLSAPSNPFRMDHANPKKVSVEPGQAVVQGGIFCGKKAALNITLAPEDFSHFGL